MKNIKLYNTKPTSRMRCTKKHLVISINSMKRATNGSILSPKSSLTSASLKNRNWKKNWKSNNTILNTSSSNLYNQVTNRSTIRTNTRTLSPALQPNIISMKKPMHTTTATSQRHLYLIQSISNKSTAVNPNSMTNTTNLIKSSLRVTTSMRKHITTAPIKISSITRNITPNTTIILKIANKLCKQMSIKHKRTI